MTEEPRATLLPCPMCGFTGRLRFEEPRWRVYFVECQDANCLTRGPQHINEPDAIAAWNRRAALEASLPFLQTGGWRDISTAPKDGARFLAYEPRSEYRHYECWWQNDFGNWEGWQDDWDSEPNPTHWMPLPTPPSRPSNEAGE